MIGAERGRDILTRRFARTVGDGVAFCRSVYGTSPMGDVVDIEGGISAGLPDVVAVPDLQHAAARAVGARCRARHRRRVQPRRDAVAGEPPQRPAPGARALRGAGHEADRRPGARVLRPRPVRDLAHRLEAVRRGHRQHLHLRAQGRPREHPHPARCASSPPTASTWSRRTTSSPPGSSRSTSGTPRHSTRPTAPSGSRPPSRSWPGCRTSWRPSWPSPSTTRAAPASTSTSQPGLTTARHSSTTPTARTGSPTQPARRWPAYSPTHPALAALLNPTINSYKRFGPDTLAPWLIDWGLDNRSAMVRIPPERGRASRMELRLGRRVGEPLPRHRRVPRRRLPRHPRQARAPGQAGGLRLRHQQGRDAPGRPADRDRRTRGRRRTCATCSGRSSSPRS